MGSPNGRIDRAMFARAEHRIRELKASDLGVVIGDAKGCAKQLRNFLSQDDGFIGGIDEQTYELLGRAVKKGFGLGKAPERTVLATYLATIENRLNNISSRPKNVRDETVAFCVYIATTDPRLLRPKR